VLPQFRKAKAAGLDARAPQAVSPIGLLAGAWDICALGPTGSAPVVAVALTERGRTSLEETQVSEALSAVARYAGDVAALGGPYPSPDAVKSRFQTITALDSAAGTPADRSVGFWSDGAQRMAVVAVARTGRRLYAEVDGATLRTNLLSVSDLLRQPS
jgi:hypothetical protein